MILPKSKLREAVVQFLYSFELSHTSFESHQSLIMDTLELSKKNAFAAEVEARKIISFKEEFDGLIANASNAYELERISFVDRNILYLALYLIKEGETMSYVVNEALRLAAKFSTPSAGAFIHAILDAIPKLPQNLVASQ